MTYNVEVRREKARGCGYRKPGKNKDYGLYLVGSLGSEFCERLPFPLAACPTCGSGIKFSRGFTFIDAKKLFAMDREPCCNAFDSTAVITAHHHNVCAVCTPLGLCGLMWVGKKFYTPESFIREAFERGISKKINAIPNGFEIGYDWIYLGHISAIWKQRMADGQLVVERKKQILVPVIDSMPGVICCFRPKAVEIVLKDENNIPDQTKKLVDKLGPERCQLIKVEPVLDPDEMPVDQRPLLQTMGMRS